MTGERPGDGTVAKAMAVLDQVAAAGRPIRFSDLLKQSPFPKATLFRLLQTLTRQGLLMLDPEHQTYSPGVRLLRLAHGAWSQSTIAPIARPWIDRLAEDTGRTVHLAQLDRGQVLFVDKRNAERPAEVFSEAGKIRPAYCTAVGKAMLAHLDPDALAKALKEQSYHAFTHNTLTSRDSLLDELQAIRLRGFAIDLGEYEIGTFCVAMPILSKAGRVLGALSVSVPGLERADMTLLQSFVPRLQVAAAAISDEAAT